MQATGVRSQSEISWRASTTSSAAAATPTVQVQQTTGPLTCCTVLLGAFQGFWSACAEGGRQVCALAACCLPSTHGPATTAHVAPPAPTALEPQVPAPGALQGDGTTQPWITERRGNVVFHFREDHRQLARATHLPENDIRQADNDIERQHDDRIENLGQARIVQPVDDPDDLLFLEEPPWRAQATRLP